MSKSDHDEDHKTPYFLTRNRGFGTATPRDELLHPVTGVSGDSLTETQYFGFNIPESRVHGYMYLWHHPNLHTVSGGAWAWQGIKPRTLACELADQWTFMSDRVLSNDLHSYTLENSYSVTVVEPLKRHRVTYSDPTRGNSLDLQYDSLTAPIMFGNGMHFEQPMKVRGEVRLRGSRYAVDCYNFRDRSWGKLRPETSLNVPPVAWHTAGFSDDFFINCTGWDHPDLEPEWKSDFPDFPADRVLNAGWVYRNGKLTEVMKFEKTTRRNRDTLFPERIDISIVDDTDRQYTMAGTVIAASEYSAWYNARASVSLVRWECEGMVGYGDTQEPAWNDYYYSANRRAQAQERRRE